MFDFSRVVQWDPPGSLLFPSFCIRVSYSLDAPLVPEGRVPAPPIVLNPVSSPRFLVPCPACWDPCFCCLPCFFFHFWVFDSSHVHSHLSIVPPSRRLSILPSFHVWPLGPPCECRGFLIGTTFGSPNMFTPFIFNTLVFYDHYSKPTLLRGPPCQSTPVTFCLFVFNASFPPLLYPLGYL